MHVPCSNVFILYRMDELINIRLQHGGQFRRACYVGGESFVVTKYDVDRFSYSVLMDFVKDCLHYTEIGGVYIRKGTRGGWQLILNDKDVNEYVQGCNKQEEVVFYIDNTIDKDSEPLIQLQPHVIIRPRKNIIQGIYVYVI